MGNCQKYIYNMAWNEGKFLKPWKQEQRATIPKPDKENYHHENSYRTVSVTAVMGKRMEKITSRRLIAKLEEDGFDVSQFAYLDNRSSNQATVAMVERVRCALNEKKKCGAVFFDFTDAFGSVDRVKLLSKLFYDFGVKGKTVLTYSRFPGR